MKLIDTNIIVYATGLPHIYKKPCSQILESVGLSDMDYAIDVELLQEVLYVYSSRGRREQGLTIFDNLMRMFPSPIPIGREEALTARGLLGKYHRLSPRDAIHASVVLVHSMEGIATADKDFEIIPDVAVFDPLEFPFV